MWCTMNRSKETVQRKAMRPKKHALNGSMKLLGRRNWGKWDWSRTQTTVVTQQIPWIGKTCNMCRSTHTWTCTHRELSINTHGFSHNQQHRTKLLWLLFSTTDSVQESVQLRLTSPLQYPLWESLFGAPLLSFPNTRSHRSKAQYIKKKRPFEQEPWQKSRLQHSRFPSYMIPVSPLRIGHHRLKTCWTK